MFVLLHMQIRKAFKGPLVNPHIVLHCINTSFCSAILGLTVQGAEWGGITGVTEPPDDPGGGPKRPRRELETAPRKAGNVQSPLAFPHQGW